ncbi:hypothetical protein [Ruegeria arenilitoris]|uniref:hypothetical protein n=1 Tax=Ruegeria arenilitoris TaxID=1173585 RepID=UPI001481241B|nr:hypothetical protein [Ruegeria arenilitoris]
MFRVFRPIPRCAAVIVAVHLLSGPVSAQSYDSSVSGFITVGSVKLSIHQRSQHHVRRYYYAPTIRHYSTRPHVSYGSTYKVRPHHGVKRHKYKGYYYPAPKRYVFKHRKHRFGLRFQN